VPVEFEIDVPLDTNVSENVRRAQYKRIMDAATAGYNWSVQQAPEDRGTLKQTSVPPEREADGAIVWGYTQPYAEAQEFGTQPYWPPARPLVEWAERVFGDPAIGYAVQHHIAQEGIKAKRFARDGRDRQQQWLDSHDFGEYFEGEQR
jgi:hypothetical protein